jgi:Rrf2 family protein
VRVEFEITEMLCLSQTTGYAVQALRCLNEESCACRQTADIARCAGVPKPYLAKIVNSLTRLGILRAKRGVGGGISLARPPEQITLLEIVEAVEGANWLGDCLLNLADCSTERACPTHHFWQRIRGEIVDELGRTTLAAVIAAGQPTFRLPRVGRRPGGQRRTSRIT